MKNGTFAGVTRALLLPAVLGLAALPAAAAEWKPQTAVAIVGEQFHINGKPTYEGVVWKPAGGGEHKIEGLLMNARLVQGIFDDLNPETRERWAYPDTGVWDPDRNTNEFVEAMADWRAHGLLAFTINLQGGSPEGYSRDQPWHNSAIDEQGGLRDDFMARLSKIIERADELGMVAILGIFYFGQDQRLEDEDAVKRAVVNTVDWVAAKRYTNVLLEIANEHPARNYRHDIIREHPEELVLLAKRRAAERRHNLPVSVSTDARRLPGKAVVDACDFILIHGNAIKDPQQMERNLDTVRSLADPVLKPVVNNEDDSPWSPRGIEPGQNPPGWDTAGITNNFMACIKNYASWGFFDWRQEGEGFDEGFQSVPVNWKISSERKKAFFGLVKKITAH